MAAWLLATTAFHILPLAGKSFLSTTYSTSLQPPFRLACSIVFDSFCSTHRPPIYSSAPLSLSINIHTQCHCLSPSPSSPQTQVDQIKGDVELPHFPSKSLRTPATGSTAEGFILKRKETLERWIQAVLEHEHLRDLETTKGFLLLPPFTNKRQLTEPDDP
eukprot:TRINITY_DN4989_c0_g1_i1.p1 TRINITY_DN4989_c0_g1~~TRINITY_DN4989_c0_g1_i1.p1  ORF type:complete len:161 (-),score=34.71 TRINITY_DN4989_c0_g1_i1:258-740(-)